jgi:hypothetical protein
MLILLCRMHPNSICRNLLQRSAAEFERQHAVLRQAGLQPTYRDMLQRSATTNGQQFSLLWKSSVQPTHFCLLQRTAPEGWRQLCLLWIASVQSWGLHLLRRRSAKRGRKYCLLRHKGVQPQPHFGCQPLLRRSVTASWPQFSMLWKYGNQYSCFNLLRRNGSASRWEWLFKQRLNSQFGTGCWWHQRLWQGLAADNPSGSEIVVKLFFGLVWYLLFTVRR